MIAADDDAAWVATDRGLWRIDARTGRAVNLPGTRGGDYPTVGEGFAWESCGQGQGPVPGFPCEGRTVLKLDPLTGAVLATIKVPGIPFAIATGLGSVWVATTSGLVKIDPVTARVVSTLPVVPLFVGTAGGAVWAGSPPDAVWTVPAQYARYRLVKIDPTTLRIEQAVGVRPCNLLATDQGIWLTTCHPVGAALGLLTRIDPATERVMYRVPLNVRAPPDCGGLDISSLTLAEGRLWVSYWDGGRAVIKALDPTTGKSIGTVYTVKPAHPLTLIGACAAPRVDIAASAGSLWVSGIDSRDVFRLGI